MRDIDLGLAVVGALVFVLGLTSRALQRLPVSIPLLSFAAGVLLGPYGFALVDPDRGPYMVRVIEEITRVALTIGVMEIALRLPAGYFRANWRTHLILLGVVLPTMAVAATAIVHWTLALGWATAAIVGAAVAPTDPILGRSVIEGEPARRALPEGMRNALLAESGANDGLAYPLVLLALFLYHPGESWPQWIATVVVAGVGGAIVLGPVLGWAARRALSWARDRHLLDRPHEVVLSVSLSLLALGMAGLVDIDGVLAAFVTGLAYARGEPLGQQRNVQQALNELLTVTVFVGLGLLAPWREWLGLGWSAVPMVVGVLALRRLPVVLALSRWIPAIESRRHAAVAGWFGPIGVAALFYSMLALRAGVADQIWTIVTLVAAVSVATFAVSAPALVRSAEGSKRTRHASGAAAGAARSSK